jgi:maltooligosyltrehalose trehalohydrolase
MNDDSLSTHRRMPFGAELQADGSTSFRLWAPSVPKAEVEIEIELGIEQGDSARRHPMTRRGDGWHEAIIEGVGAGTRYRYVVNDGLKVPDPASRYNPDDVHGASMVMDMHRHKWRDTEWRGRPWSEAVVYELHVGAFTPQGTYAAAAEHLQQLAELGITAIELMPLADFPGTRNWGYDGVLQFAPDSSYGHPDELKSLIDRAHELGLMVMLDVVYNHFGPDGNYLYAYCPEFFNSKHHTPWGSAINFDGESNETVRRFFSENALYWIEEFHFDGLRMDAVDRIRDDSPQHIMCEVAQVLRNGPGRTRQVHVVIENDVNEASRLERHSGGAPKCATAQWNDGLHHAAHVVLTGQVDGYYDDFAADPIGLLARSLAEGFAYQGEHSVHRDAPHGSPSAHLPSGAFVSCLQNHDQIGNRAFGERIDALADSRRIEAVHACLLLSPHVPLLFMGEEFAASTPFLFFCDFHGELGAAVSNGRRQEFARFAHFADKSARLAIPDPNDASTFEASKLRWAERDASPHRERVAFMRRLLELRATHLVPRLAGQLRGGIYSAEAGLLRVEWLLGDGSTWFMLANFADTDVTVDSAPSGHIVYQSHAVTHAGGALVLEPAAVVVVSA